jgi:hypothetical protein
LGVVMLFSIRLGGANEKPGVGFRYGEFGGNGIVMILP